MKINQIKLEVQDTYKKMKKYQQTLNQLIMKVINKPYLDEKLLQKDGHLSILERNYNEFKLQYNKQSVEKILFQRAVRTTIQRLFDKGLFENYDNDVDVLKNFLFVTRRRCDLEKNK